MDEGLSVVLEAVSKTYGAGSTAVAALRTVDISVGAGEFVSVMGASGSGKSTLLNIVAGLDTPTNGRVLIEGQDIAFLSDDARSDLRLQKMGFVFQSFNLFPTFTVEENVMWPLELLGVGWRRGRERAAAALAQVGVAGGARERRPAELSGGEQQRVALARALVTEPRLLLADEPTGNLDSRTGQEILDLLRAQNQVRGITIVLVTHSTFAATYGHRTIEMRDGCIVHEARAEAQGGAGRIVPLRT